MNTYKANVSMDGLPVQLLENDEKKIDIWVAEDDSYEEMVCTPVEILKTNTRKIKVRDIDHPDFDYELVDEDNEYDKPIRYKDEWLDNITMIYTSNDFPSWLKCDTDGFYIKTDDNIFHFGEKVKIVDEFKGIAIDDNFVNIKSKRHQQIRPYCLYISRNKFNKEIKPEDFTYLVDTIDDEYLIKYIHPIDDKYSIIHERIEVKNQDVIRIRIQK